MSLPAQTSVSYRPQLTADGVVGARCDVCTAAYAPAIGRCAACGARTTPAMFAPTGTIWSSTTVHVAVGDRQPPYRIGYVDLDGGPRLLVALPATSLTGIGDRVVVRADPGADDLIAEVIAR